MERIEVTPDVTYYTKREKQEIKEYTKNLPLASRKEFPPITSKLPLAQEQTTPTPSPGRQPQIPGTNKEIERIEQQIIALTVAKNKIMERNKEKPRNPNRRNSHKQIQDPPEKTRGPRIVEDITILPPRNPPPPTHYTEALDGEWIEVNRNRKRSTNNQQTNANIENDTTRKRQGYNNQNNRQFTRKRLPKSAAISIKTSEGVTYAEALRKIKQETSLAEYGIKDIKIRRAANKNTLLEITGEDHVNKANALADKIKEVLNDMAKVTRPTRRADLRIIGFDESVMVEEIECAIAETGNCKIDEVKVGQIGYLKNGQGIVIVNCPLHAAISVSNLTKIKIGWTVSKVIMLKPRPLQCYRCWHYGHASFNCRNPINRTGACFNCCSMDHKIQNCKTPPTCAVCQEQNLPYEHRIGSGSCKSKLLGNRNTADRKTADERQKQRND